MIYTFEEFEYFVDQKREKFEDSIKKEAKKN